MSTKFEMLESIYIYIHTIHSSGVCVCVWQLQSIWPTSNAIHSSTALPYQKKIIIEQEIIKKKQKCIINVCNIQYDLSLLASMQFSQIFLKKLWPPAAFSHKTYICMKFRAMFVEVTELCDYMHNSNMEMWWNSLKGERQRVVNNALKK